MAKQRQRRVTQKRITEKEVQASLDYAIELLRAVKKAVAAGACEEGVLLKGETLEATRLVLAVGEGGGCCG